MKWTDGSMVYKSWKYKSMRCCRMGIRRSRRNALEFVAPETAGAATSSGRKQVKKHSAVTELRKKGRFDVVAHRLPQAPVDERPMEMTLGLDLMYAEVCKCIEDEQLGITGLYGMEVPEKLPS